MPSETTAAQPLETRQYKTGKEAFQNLARSIKRLIKEIPTSDLEGLCETNLELNRQCVFLKTVIANIGHAIVPSKQDHREQARSIHPAAILRTAIHLVCQEIDGHPVEKPAFYAGLQHILQSSPHSQQQDLEYSNQHEHFKAVTLVENLRGNPKPPSVISSSRFFPAPPNSRQSSGFSVISRSASLDCLQP